MDGFDLDISNYSLDDLLNLLKLPKKFDSNDLKKAKKIVLMTHPDKSKLPKEYFLFYSQAYKTIYKIFEFKTRNSDITFDTSYNDIIDSNNDNENQNKFKNIKSKKFNGWFNKIFDELYIKNENEKTGYNDWLKNEPIKDFSNVTNKQSMNDEFEKKKKNAKALVLHEDYNEICNNLSSGSSELNNNTSKAYNNNDMFNNLNYQDIKQAYTPETSVIPVNNSDYINRQKFRNIHELQNHRSSQNTKPNSLQQAKNFLNNKKDIDNNIANETAYNLTRELEINEKNNEIFLRKFNLLK